jgi:hypothetical protein
LSSNVSVGNPLIVNAGSLRKMGGKMLFGTVPLSQSAEKLTSVHTFTSDPSARDNVLASSQTPHVLSAVDPHPVKVPVSTLTPPGPCWA